jgi:hypothetical protein
MARVGSPPPPPSAPPGLAARLTEFDELPAAERAALSAHARACPSCGPALGLLEAAEAHLAAAARRSGPREACPSAEDLFDFAKAPGARPLPAGRAAAVAAHLERCAECSDLRASLAARPPVPLIVDALPQETPPRHLRLLRLAPLAAAAAVVLALLLQMRRDEDSPALAAGPSAIEFPAAEVLRGDQGGALAWPRGALLSPPAAGAGLTFELDLPERAGRWRVRLLGREDDPFTQGRELFVLEGEGATAQAEALPPGAYTWEAWTEVDGLEVPLGRRDFDVRDDAATRAELAELATLPEPQRSTRTLALLAARGYHADARAWARTLPPSSERDAFLARTPGR